MNKKQKEEYIKGVKFGLKDKQKTTDKWTGYKDTEWQEFIKEYSIHIEKHLNGLSSLIHEEIITSLWFRYVSLEFETKSKIRSFMTRINQATLNVNKNLIDGLFPEANNTHKVGFNIRFYLDNYDKINDIMKEVLINMVV